MDNLIKKLHATTHQLTRIIAYLEAEGYPCSKAQIRKETRITAFDDALNWLKNYGFITEVFDRGGIKFIAGEKSKLGINTLTIINTNEKYEIKLKPIMTKEEFIKTFSDVIERLKKEEVEEEKKEMKEEEKVNEKKEEENDEIQYFE